MSSVVCLFLQVHIYVFLCRIVGKTWPARTAVKAERSEFIWSRDGGRSRSYRVVPGEGKHRYPHVSNIRLPSVSVATLPSALWCERHSARCKLGVLDSAGAATCYCDLSLDLADGVLGQANDAVTGTRLMTLNLHTSGTELCNRRQCGPATWS